MPESLIGFVPDGWQETTLGNLCASEGGSIQTGPFGSQLHASDYVQAGIPSVMPQNIGDNTIIDEGIARITVADAKRLSRYLLQADDIVYSRRGDVERRALVRPDQEGWLCGTGCLRVRVGTSANPQFVSYFLGHPEVRAWIVRHAVGATMANLNTEILSAVPVLLPPRATQNAVASVLGALDCKILANNLIAAATRELAVTQFKASLLAGRPVRLVVSDITKFLSRGITPRYAEDSDQLMVLNQKCVRNGRIQLEPARRTLSETVSAPKMLQPGDVLVNSTGVGTLGRVARWVYDRRCTVDSHVTIVRFDTERVDPVCAGFAMLAAQPEIEALGEGSTGQTELSRARLGGVSLTLPSDSEATKIRPLLVGLEEKGNVALEESFTLARLRDTLLPGLMSGEIRVREAEKAVEEVT